MTIYYDDRAVRITSELIRVEGRAYPLTEVGRVWHVRGDRSWGALAGRGALLAALGGPLVAAVIGILIAVRLHTSVTVTIAIVGVSVLIGLAAAPVADYLLEHVDRSYSRGAHQLEIWAQWRGTPVRLLATGDALRFGQIYRALERAVEQAAIPVHR
ncbi:hypothetical protein I0C86_42705 [Plantactinospora sp. S1510]|uniref:Uncharacterized protein n=1 Tax=Plantactinospora alkalitolerans TaxID=2789879 RepID=A0ABS0HB43_9ACTN|nr:DUF6232 family protein [Plantactinospora alkalitolerans]MBF9135554.1 hypothetical protein [Plantactinospora alkalitolerans]